MDRLHEMSPEKKNQKDKLVSATVLNSILWDNLWNINMVFSKDKTPDQSEQTHMLRLAVQMHDIV